MFWEMMARLIGRPDLAVDRGLVFDTQQLAVQYAMMGDGLALVDPMLFAEDIKAGRLVRPFDIWLDEGYGYYLTTHPEDLSNEAVALFRSWLIARFAADRQQLEEAGGRRAAKRARRNSIGICQCLFPAWRRSAPLADSLRARNRTAGRRRMSNEGRRGSAAPAPARPPSGRSSRRRRKPQPKLPFPPVELVSRRRTRIDPSGRAQGAARDRHRRAARRGQGAAEGRRRRRRPALATACASTPRWSNRKIGLAPQELHAARAQPRAQRRDRRPASSPSARSPRRPTRSTARAAGGPAIIATSRISSGSGRRSTPCMSGAAIPSSRSTSTPRSAISTRLFDMLTLSDKPIHAYSLGRERILDGIEMARLARGIDDETLEREPSLFTVINSSSPLRLDTPMMEGVMQMARRNQVVVLTPFTLAGAMAPVTLAGALGAAARRGAGGPGRRADRARRARRSSMAASPPTST